MPIDPAAATLRECLADFQREVNRNERVRRLIQGWDRRIVVEPLDEDGPYTMVVRELEVAEVRPGLAEGDGVVHLQADALVLKRIFTGGYNPATAVLDGALAVFSDERDKVKLEAVAIVIWGI